MGNKSKSGIATIRSYTIRLVVVYFLFLSLVVLGYRILYEIPKDKALVGEIQNRELASIVAGFTFLESRLAFLLEDWAYWDDSYLFVQDPTEHLGFIESNIIPSTFVSLGLIGIQYLDNQFSPVYELGYDPETQTLFNFSELGIDIKERLEFLGFEENNKEFLLYNDWVQTSKGLAKIAVSTISTSNADEYPVGYLIFIKSLTEEDILEISEITRLHLELVNSTEYLNSHPLTLLSLEEGVMDSRVRLLFDSVLNEPVIGLRISHNTIYKDQILEPGILLLIFAMAIVPFIILFMIEKRLVSPLEQNAKKIQNMVKADRLEVLEKPFALNELEEMRNAFNNAVGWVEEQQNQLKTLSYTDSLTGIANRRAVDQFVEHASRQARRQEISMMWLLLDLDHFKKFNDTLGHQAGDEVLRQVGNVLANFTKRATEYCGRTGGEEFVVLMMGEENSIAYSRADELRRMIENLQITHPKSSTGPFLTVSIGGIWVDDMSKLPLDYKDVDLFELADKALYRAKDQGRNRIVIESLQDR